MALNLPILELLVLLLQLFILDSEGLVVLIEHADGVLHHLVVDSVILGTQLSPQLLALELHSVYLISQFPDALIPVLHCILQLLYLVLQSLDLSILLGPQDLILLPSRLVF